ACIEILRDPTEARLRALKGKEYVRRNFLMPRLLRDWLVLYNRLLGNDTAGTELAVVGAAQLSIPLAAIRSRHGRAAQADRRLEPRTGLVLAAERRARGQAWRRRVSHCLTRACLVPRRDLDRERDLGGGPDFGRSADRRDGSRRI